MHELSIATELYRQCRARCPETGARLARVWIEVGELTAVEPALLRFAWEATIAEGPDAGAALDIEWRPARQCCARCGVEHERRGGAWRARCPGCGGPLAIEGGGELDLLRLSYEVEEPVEQGVS